MAQNRYYSSDLRAVYERITKREEDVKKGLMPVPEKDKPTNPTLIQLREIEENNARFLASMAAFTLDENGDAQTMLDRLYPKVDPNVRDAAAKYLDKILEMEKLDDSESKLKDALSPSR